MGNGLLGGRHDAIVSCHDDDGNISHLGTTGTHGGKGLVTRRVEERNSTTVLQLHVVCTYVLRNTTSLTGNDVGVTNIVQK